MKTQTSKVSCLRLVLALPALLLALLLAGCAHTPGPHGDVMPLPLPIQADEGSPIDRRNGASP
jgi:hypothetical protein